MFLKYIQWIKREDYYTQNMDDSEATALAGMFLSPLAVERGVCAKSQSARLDGLVFFYRRVLKIDPEGLDFARPLGAVNLCNR